MSLSATQQKESFSSHHHPQAELHALLYKLHTAQNKLMG